MAKLGLGHSFIKLVRGLVEGASSKIHANGLFSNEIPDSKGVRQGCPLSPLLFAISSQPLMDFLDHLLRTQQL